MIDLIHKKRDAKKKNKKRGREREWHLPVHSGEMMD